MGELHNYTKMECHFLRMSFKFISIENATLYLPYIKNVIFSKNCEKLSFREKLTFLLRIFFLNILNSDCVLGSQRFIIVHNRVHNSYFQKSVNNFINYFFGNFKRIFSTKNIFLGSILTFTIVHKKIIHYCDQL